MNSEQLRYFELARLQTHALGGAESRLWNWASSWAKRLPSDPLS